MNESRSLPNRIRRSGVGEIVTDAGKFTLRRAGMATASMRPPPDFLIVGAKRGGTTSLWEYLAQHEGVMPLFPKAQKVKGTYFFDEQWNRGTNWYLSHFPSRLARKRAQRKLGYSPVAGEASPYYLFHPLAPQRAATVAPEALIIAVLRDPVERAYSHWKERSNHTETESFEHALALEEERTSGEEARILADPTYISSPHRHETYIAQSRYAPMLRRWFAAFGPERVLVEAAEVFYADPPAFLNRITARLGLPEITGVDTSPRNAEPSSAMSSQARSFLEQRLRDDITETQELLGRDLPW